MLKFKIQRLMNWFTANPIKWALPLIVLSPVAVNLLIECWPFPSVGYDESWLGFWGNYLGGAFTLLALACTISWERKRSERDKRTLEDQIRLDGENKRIELDLSLYDAYCEALDGAIDYYGSLAGRGIGDLEGAISSLKEEFAPVWSMARRVKSQLMLDVMHKCVAEYAQIERYPEIDLSNEDVIKCSVRVYEKMRVARLTLDILTPITTLGFPPRFNSPRRDEVVRKYLGIDED